MGGFWSAATVVGPILFLAILGFVMYRNHSASKRDLERSEQGAVDLREQMTAEREAREGKSN